MTRWFIYALSEGDEVVYIGRSTRPERRHAQHKWARFKGRDVQFTVLCCACGVENASAIEARLIAAYNPRLNVAFKDKPTPVVGHVETMRQTPNGPVPVTMRLREGMMHPDEARAVWLNGPGTMQERLDRMGWKLGTAYQMFGSFGLGDALMKRAQKRREERWAASETQYQALGKSNRELGPKPDSK